MEGFLTYYVASDIFNFVLDKCQGNKCTHYGILKRGKYVESKTKNVRLILSSQGNLEVYCGKNIVWSKGSNNADYLYFHDNGELVLYDKSNNPIWTASDLWNRSSIPKELVMQNDGNLVLYDECGRAYWQSKTYEKCEASSGLMTLTFLSRLNAFVQIFKLTNLS